jgi:hypothetical protein
VARPGLIASLLAIFFAMTSSTPLEAAGLRGNLHTHTSESDGDSTPAEVVAWYAAHGYDFLVLTDHDEITKASHDTLILIPGEEVTDRLPDRPIHVNAIGLTSVVKPQGGETAVEVLQRNVEAVRNAGGLALVNHPNFGWSFGSAELLRIRGATMLEIASGHPYVNPAGPPGAEEIWDRLLTAGQRIWGVAVDDMHHLKRPWDTDVALPGKGWVVVRAAKRDQASILAALRSGNFYASTGVELDDFGQEGSRLVVRVKEKNRARYLIEFLGAEGRVLSTSQATTAQYTVLGHESYVRVRITDSNGRKAWTQPFFPAASRKR